MTADYVINILASITLVEMMVTIGLGVNLSDVLNVGRKGGLVARSALANYVLVPAAAVGLLLLFRAQPMVAAGILVAAACPGAPYGPPFTSMAKGNVAVAVGLMVILAGSSAIVAPILLRVLLPVVPGDASLNINVAKIVGTLLGAQLLPLGAGLWLRRQYPTLADTLKRPATLLSTLLNLLTLGVILFVQFRVLIGIRLVSYLGMLLLVIATIAAGWVSGRNMNEDQKSMVLTTGVRNVGVGLVIVSSSFPGTAAITAAIAFALFQTIVLALIASAWGRLTPDAIVSTSRRAA